MKSFRTKKNLAIALSVLLVAAIVVLCIALRQKSDADVDPTLTLVCTPADADGVCTVDVELTGLPDGGHYGAASIAAGQVTGERVGKVHQPRADAAVVHDRAAHDEKRDRKERERLRGRDELLHQQVRHGRRVNEAEVGQRRGKERVGDRDAREIQHERDDDRQDRKKRAHASTSPSSLLPLLRSLMKMTSE